MRENLFPKAFFVTGTDTGVGKTLVCAVLLKGLPHAAYWKPIQSGLEEISDTQWLRQVTGLPDSHFMPEAYRLSQPLSPHAAAQIDGIQILLEKITIPDVKEFSHLIVEGAGGILVPINSDHYIKDLILHLNLPVLLVARSTLGTINHTLLSLQCLRQTGLAILGVVMNGPKNPINRRAIEFYGNTCVCAEIETLPRITPQILFECFCNSFNL